MAADLVQRQFKDICDADNQGAAANKKQKLRKIDKTHHIPPRQALRVNKRRQAQP